MAEGKVTTTTHDGITTIEFFHPSHNAMPGTLLAELTDAISQAGQGNDTRVIVLKSAGDRTFCAGASFEELVAIQNFERGKRFFMGFANVINACRTCPRLIIGRVHGKAVGGGVGIAAAVDYCMSTKYASIKLSELALGIGPFVIGPAIERKIGTAAFGQLAINATEWQTAKWARDKGLFAQVFETTSQLDAYIQHFSYKLSQMSPQAMTELKRVLWQGTEHWDTLLEERAEISGKLVLSTYTREAITAFKEKA